MAVKFTFDDNEAHTSNGGANNSSDDQQVAGERTLTRGVKVRVLIIRLEKRGGGHRLPALILTPRVCVCVCKHIK